MSFLRTFRSNLILSTAPPGGERTPRNGTKSTSGTLRTSSTSARKQSVGGHSRTAVEDTGGETPDRGRRASGATTLSGRTGSKHSTSSSIGSGSRYGKENPAPIVVYLDKQQQQQQHEVKKQPTSILRTNTFTKHDDDDEEERQRARHAISRSDTFTIHESSDETVVDSSTFTRRGEPASPVTRDVFEPLYAKNIELSSHERLPVVVDSRTYRRKKSLKASKPVQKVESFIKRFERTLFSKPAEGTPAKGRSQQQGSRKGSLAEGPPQTGGTGGPRFRDVGINCKLDEEEKFRAKLEAMKRGPRQDSRDSLVIGQRDEHERRRSQSPSKRRTFGASYERRSSSSLSNGVVVLPLKEEEVTPSPSPELADAVPFRRPTESTSSFLKNRQKEIEMGYSVVNKRQPAPLALAKAGSPERVKVNSGTWRKARLADPDPMAERERAHYGGYSPPGAPRTIEEHGSEVSRDQDQNSVYGRYPFRTDTYRTLKEQYDERQQQQQQQHQGRRTQEGSTRTSSTKPIGIASPRMSGVRQGERSPPAPSRKDSPSDPLPTYTFGTEQLQQRRSRFQQFQKSFRKMDDSASDVSVQQSFFVPI